MRVILIRHGESTSDLEPRRIEGMADFPLSERGMAQVRALGERIAADYSLDGLICSPLQRARHTAQAISQACGLPLQVDERLRERSWGVLGGVTFEEADATHPAWRKLPVHVAPPEGETVLQQFSRVAEFWLSLLDGPRDRTVAVVSHGGTINALYRVALGLPADSRHGFLNADTAVHEWQVNPDGSVYVLFANCSRHLRG